MQAALALALATQESDVHHACASKETGSYDLNRHMYLRRSFVSVYLTAEKEAVDGHKHYVEAAGFSEHQLFVQAIMRNDDAKPLPRGPKNSRPAEKKRPKQKAKRSEALKRMLAAPGAKLPLAPAEARCSGDKPSGTAPLPCALPLHRSTSTSCSRPCLEP